MGRSGDRSKNTPKLSRGLLNLKGMTFGDLKVIKLLPYRHKRKRMWLCQCSCGSPAIAVRHDYLLHTNNPKTHCGCKNKGLATQHQREYHIWNSMIRRCHVPTHAGYSRYGGRGISVCPEWRDPQTGFKAFLAYVGERPSPQHSLDRIDPDGNYEPGNVRWVTAKHQARNKRGSIFLPHPKTGEMVPAAEVAEFLGMTYQGMRAKYIKEGLWPSSRGIK
ncbi:MAG: hypothetical protein QXG97_05975 [Nitrososphaerota archaeon]